MTHENALDGVSEVLLGEGHHGGGEEGGGGDPVVQPEDPAVDADFVEVGESTDLKCAGDVGLQSVHLGRSKGPKGQSRNL